MKFPFTQVKRTTPHFSFGLIKSSYKRPAFRIAIFKIAIWLGSRKQEKIEHSAVHTIFLCFPKAYQIAILEIAFLSAGLFYFPSIATTFGTQQFTSDWKGTFL